MRVKTRQALDALATVADGRAVLVQSNPAQRAQPDHLSIEIPEVGPLAKSLQTWAAQQQQDHAVLVDLVATLAARPETVYVQERKPVSWSFKVKQNGRGDVTDITAVPIVT